MKKILLLLVGVLMIGTSAMAQGKKDYKKANRLLGTYNLDPGANADKLAQAQELITSALEDAEVQAMAKAWILKGKILNTVASKESEKKILDPEYQIMNVGAANDAYLAFKKALEVGTKKFEIKDAVSNLKQTAGSVGNAAITAFQNQDYDEAFKDFKGTLEIDELLQAQGEESSFVHDSLKQQQLLYTAISGYYAEKFEESEQFFNKSIELGNPDPFIYEGLYNMKKDTDKEAAYAILLQGREKYPDDPGLLYAEINYMVAEGQLEALIGKLEDAVKKDPTNVSVYTTLGAVYDNLAGENVKAGNSEKAQGYFDKSQEWFEKALAMDEKNFDALYSLGALFYNKAATYTEPLNELANDFSAEGNKKYDALKQKMDDLFEKAFPYFSKAEGLNPNDMNTLLAIKEIYARKGDVEKTNEYKERLEALNK